MKDVDSQPARITYDKEVRVLCCTCEKGGIEDPNLIVLCEGNNCYYAVHQQCVTGTATYSISTVPRNKTGDYLKKKYNKIRKKVRQAHYTKNKKVVLN